MLVTQFFKEAQMLVVDRCLASRLAMKESLIEMGANPARLVLAKNLSEAHQAIGLGIPDLIIGDYHLDDGLGLSLVRLNRHAIFILVSGESSQAAIAKAAEEEVDDFIFKPYADSDFKKILKEAVERKLQPQEQDRWLESGKRFMVEGATDSAVLHFERLRSIHPTYATGCAYLGQVNRTKELLEQAKKEYRSGLAQNDVHFRCLMGLHEVSLQQKEIDQAYAALKEVVLSFPEHPERLSLAVALAIRTKNFMDIEVFYDVFQEIYQKTPALVNHMSSALSVSGRYYLSRKKTDSALTVFESALKVGGHHPKFLTYIVNHLSQAGFSNEAFELYKRYVRANREHLDSAA